MITDNFGSTGGVTRGLYADFTAASAAVVIAFVVISLYSFYVQTIVLTRFGDGDEYFFAAEQMAAGQTIRAEVPYAYRIALPWLVARTFPERIELGFRIYNTAAAAAGTALLLMWLRAFGIRPGVAALTTLLYVANWIGPARFLYYYPIYVDPPFIAFSMGALLLIESLRRRFTWARTGALSALCFLGGSIRETMILAPIAFVFANVGRRRVCGEGEEDAPIPLIARLLPLACGAIAVVLCRQVPVAPRRTLSAVENAIYLFHDKPLFTLPLALFMTFGPVLAVVFHDWRAARDVVRRHAYLAVFFASCFAAGYVGGHETERYLIWAAPVVYLLIATALQNHGEALMRSAWVFVALAGAQLAAEHVFFGIPDPSFAVADFSTLTTIGEKIWGVINRLVIIDDFSWNLWSYFGSRPFHALLLAVYVVFSVLLILYLRWAERPRPIGTHT
jgi:hypothetical protein